MPKKKEYLLYAPLTRAQKSLYDAILKRDLRDYLIKRKTKGLKEEQQPTQDQTNDDDEQKAQRTTKASIDYKEKSDRQYFKELEKATDENTTPVKGHATMEKKQQASKSA